MIPVQSARRLLSMTKWESSKGHRVGRYEYCRGQITLLNAKQTLEQLFSCWLLLPTHPNLTLQSKLTHTSHLT
jgi:hypothetical protein